MDEEIALPQQQVLAGTRDWQMRRDSESRGHERAEGSAMKDEGIE
jgi:hypothetical protein